MPVKISRVTPLELWALRLRARVSVANKQSTSASNRGENIDCAQPSILRCRQPETFCRLRLLFETEQMPALPRDESEHPGQRRHVEPLKRGPFPTVCLAADHGDGADALQGEY